LEVNPTYPGKDRIKDFKENYQKSHFRLIWDSIWNHEYLAFDKPYCRGVAWLWLIKEAYRGEQPRQKAIEFGGKVRIIPQEYGQVIASQRFMAEAFEWSTTKVRTYLRHLSNTFPPTISVKQNQQINVITICNFRQYQNPKLANQPGMKPAGNRHETSMKPNYNSKTGKQVNSKEEYSSERRQKTVVSEPPDSDLVLTKKAKPTWKNSEQQATCEDFVRYCRISKSRHVRLIGEWADEIKPMFATQGQWWIFFEMNLRAARQLANFTDSQIAEGYGRMEKARYLTKKQSMATLLKYTVDQSGDQ
jgi:hypothetical protein